MKENNTKQKYKIYPWQERILNSTKRFVLGGARACGKNFLRRLFVMKVAKAKDKKNKGKFFFSVVEYGIMNMEFVKKHPDIRIARIEIWHEDEPYDVEEIQFALPSEMFVRLRDAIDFKHCDYFQFGNIHSEDLEKHIKDKNKKKRKQK